MIAVCVTQSGNVILYIGSANYTNVCLHRPRSMLPCMSIPKLVGGVNVVRVD